MKNIFQTRKKREPFGNTFGSLPHETRANENLKGIVRGCSPEFIPPPAGGGRGKWQPLGNTLETLHKTYQHIN